MKKYNFNQQINRIGTNTSKWDNTKKVFGSKDILPLWVADTDFAVAPEIQQAIEQRASHPIYGYNLQTDAFYQSLVHWAKRRHDWSVEQDWVITAPGVVPSIAFSLLSLSDVNDGVIIQPPIYPPFFAVIEDNQRKVVENPLRLENGQYTIDFVDLEEKFAQPQNKLFLFCSPHNPIGRVWSKSDLEKIVLLAKKYNVTILSDEIHSDIVFSGQQHTVLASLDQDNIVTYLAASKTFNIAGLNTSFIVIANKDLRAKVQAQIQKLHLNRNNIFGVIATQVAYEQGESWLQDALQYMETNADLAVEFINTRLPKVKVTKPQGTYLLWLDFRSYFTTSKQLDEFLVYKAKVGLNSGRKFGTCGDGFARLNLGTQKKILKEALIRIETALNKL